MGLGMFLIFRVNIFGFLFLAVEVGLSVFVFGNFVRWKFVRKRELLFCWLFFVIVG